MMKAENGCQHKVAMDVMDDASEYCWPTRPRSVDRPKVLPFPNTVLS